MFDRIQHLFDCLVGEPAVLQVPLAAFRTPTPLPEKLAQPACWRRGKRVSAVRPFASAGRLPAAR